MKNRSNLFAAALLAISLVWSVGQLPALADDYRVISLNWNVAAPGANTDAVADITWGEEETCRVSVQLATGSVCNLMVSRGGTEFALGLNSNSALVAGALYQFDVTGMEKGDIVNFQVETDGILQKIDLGALRPTR